MKPIQISKTLMLRPITVSLMMSTLLLAACATPPPTRSGDTKSPASNTVASASPKANGDAPTEPAKEEPKSIAVTDIYFKRELREMIYLEEAKEKYDIKSASKKPNAVGEPSAPQATPPAGQSDAKAYMKSARYKKVQGAPNPDGSSADSLIPPGGADQTASAYAANYESSYVKKLGVDRKIEYGELRGVVGSIRGMLIKSGYKVVQAKPAVVKPEQNDAYFDIVERIKTGEFNNANYVLYGVLTEISAIRNNEQVPGSTASVQQSGIDLTADFSLIDTQTFQVVASFVAMGSGKDIRIDGQKTGYKPSVARMMRQVANSLAEDVAIHLAAQNFIVAAAAPNQKEVRNEKQRLSEDGSTLKIYRK